MITIATASIVSGRRRTHWVQEGVWEAELVHDLALQDLRRQDWVCDADALRGTSAQVRAHGTDASKLPLSWPEALSHHPVPYKQAETAVQAAALKLGDATCAGRSGVVMADMCENGFKRSI